ncbi:MAG: complex I NDUFA9 subunit family protein [Pseudomonadota bacterium]|nr:complex I NDUFA9 subunit family protein [Pseudomonadota bacterium]
MRKTLSGKKVVIFGGAGFIGSHLVKHICKESCQINIITRNPKDELPIFFANDPGQIKLKKINKFSQDEIDNQIEGSDVVFNLIGILAESKKSSFNFVHIKIPEMIAKSAKKNKVSNLIHVSALNVNKIKTSTYARSKYLGEVKVREIFPNSLIIRPGVVFGKGDNFTNFFSFLAKFSPVLPIIGTPSVKFSQGIFNVFDFSKKVKFQPIYVGDLVKFIIEKYHEKNKEYDLVGPVIKNFTEIYDVILNHQGKKRFYVPLPFFLANIIAFFLENLPKPLLTQDQINLLHYDSVSTKGLANLKSVIKNPASMETIVKNYL